MSKNEFKQKRRAFARFKKIKGNDVKAGCGQTGRFAKDSVKVGDRSFPNKRILRNNLCLPACRILMYKRMALEI